MGTKLVSRTVEKISQNIQSGGMGVQALDVLEIIFFSGPPSM